MKFSVLLCGAILAGCANTETGIVPIGSGAYMSSRVVHMGRSGSAVKADLYREAAAFCAKSGKQVDPLTSNAHDPSLDSYASAEIQFRCN